MKLVTKIEKARYPLDTFNGYSCKIAVPDHVYHPNAAWNMLKYGEPPKFRVDGYTKINFTLR